MPSQNRQRSKAWEVIFQDVSQQDLVPLLSSICQKKYGIYKAFAICHDDKTKHAHFGLLLRDKPLFSSGSPSIDYFCTDNRRPSQVGTLNHGTKGIDKLNIYYAYCTNKDVHKDTIMSDPLLHKFDPEAPSTGQSPKNFFNEEIYNGLTVQSLRHSIRTKLWNYKVHGYALEFMEKLCGMIAERDMIDLQYSQSLKYAELKGTYRQFQIRLTNILDTQNSRNIHCHADNGDTGKNHFIDIENLREDTIIMQSAETKRMAYAWNPLIHKRILIDVPKGKMEFLNTSAIEKLKNGMIQNTMYKTYMKVSLFKPTILILGNEQVSDGLLTQDRLTRTTTSPPQFMLEIVE